MSVSITFEPSGISGLIAEGTYLVDAARRLGAPLGNGCVAGKGECPACLIQVKSGVELVSPPSGVEVKLLGDELLDQTFRLACQVKIENQGELVIRVSARKARPAAASNPESDLRKKFGELPLTKKIATLLQLEAIAMSEVIDSAIEKPFALGSKAIDAIATRARSVRAREGKTK